MATPPVFSAGAVLTAGQMNAVGMWLIKTDTITSGTSKEITGAFSSDYTNYRILLSGVQTSTTDTLVFRFGTTATGYYGTQYYDLYTGASTGANRFNNAIGLNIGFSENQTGSANVSIDVGEPNTTNSRKIITGNYFGAGYAGWFGGILVSSTAYTSFLIYTAGGNAFTACNIAVYGYRK